MGNKAVVQYSDTITISPPTAHVFNPKFSLSYKTVFENTLLLPGESGGGNIKGLTGISYKSRAGREGERTPAPRLTCAPSACTYSGVGLWPGPSSFGLLLPQLDLGNTEVEGTLFDSQQV